MAQRELEIAVVYPLSRVMVQIENKSESDLDLLRRINTFAVGGVPVPDFFTYQGVSVWSFFQGDLWSLIRRRARTLSPTEVATSRSPMSFTATLFILSTSLAALVWAWIRRPKVALHTPDIVLDPWRADPRVGLIYQWLHKHGIVYVEFVHTVPGRRMFRNWFQRRRPIMYLESLEILHGLFVRLGLRRRSFPAIDWKVVAASATDLNNVDRQFAFFMLKRYAMRAEFAAFRIDALRFLSRFLPFKTFLSLDDPRNFSELVFAFKEKGIMTHSFQHGRLDKYSTVHVCYDIPPTLCVIPDVFWLWNEYNREKLTRLSPVYAQQPEKVKVGGLPFSKEIPPGKTLPGKKMVILMLYEGYAPPEQIREYLTRILARGDAEVIFSFRPDFELNYQMERSGVALFAQNPHFRVVNRITTTDWARIDLVLGTTSTLLEEMIGAGKPVAVLHTSTSQATDLVEDGLAELVTPDTLNRLPEIAHTNPAELARRRHRVAITVSINDTLEKIFT